MKNSDIDKKNKSFRRQSDEAKKSKPTLQHIEKKFHPPNRPSI